MPFMKDIVVLGSTGSIGKQTLDVAAFQGYRVRAISACRSVRLAEEQIRRFHPVYCAMADEQAAKDLQTRVLDTDTKILSGNEGGMRPAGLGGVRRRSECGGGQGRPFAHDGNTRSRKAAGVGQQGESGLRRRFGQEEGLGKILPCSSGGQ